MPAFAIPNGPLNITSLFPSVNFADVADYFIQLKDAAGVVVATTTLNKFDGCGAEHVRLFFVNASGEIDGINGKHLTSEIDVKSDLYRVSVPIPFERSGGGHRRTNIQAAVSHKIVLVDFPEKNMPWLIELLTSPGTWIADTVNASFIPVVLLDAKKLIRKEEEERYNYDVEIEYKLSNDLIIQR